MTTDLANCSVHTDILHYGELDRLDAQFAAEVERRFPGVPFRLETRPHPNVLLNAAGDRLRVAIREDADG